MCENVIGVLEVKIASYSNSSEASSFSFFYFTERRGLTVRKQAEEEEDDDMGDSTERSGFYNKL